MSESSRVIRLSSPESTADETVRRVLDLARDLDPPPETMARMTERLSAALPAGALTAGATASLLGKGAAGASLMTKGVLVKGAVAVVALSGAGVGVWAATRTTASLRESTPDRGSHDQNGPNEQNEHPPPEDRPLAKPSADAARPSWIAPLPATSAPFAPRPPTSALAPTEPESSILVRAHEELLHGSAPKALSLAGEHKRLYPRGALAQERDMIEIEALVKMGAMPAARARAETFRKAYPASTYAERIDALVGAPR